MFLCRMDGGGAFVLVASPAPPPPCCCLDNVISGSLSGFGDCLGLGVAALLPLLALEWALCSGSPALRRPSDRSEAMAVASFSPRDAGDFRRPCTPFLLDAACGGCCCCPPSLFPPRCLDPKNLIASFVGLVEWPWCWFRLLLRDDTF